MMIHRWICCCALLVSGFLPCVAAAAKSPEKPYDLVVYGGTAAGAVTAVAAARHGLHVALLEPGNHIGGMLTGGLSATDLGDPEVIGGIAREFFTRTARIYHVTSLSHAADWRFEPHVGEAVLTDMLREAGVEMHRHETLLESHAVIKRDRKIVSIVTTSGKRWRAKIFADCSYEGDLMAQAGVPYTWGRESTSQYNESLAGVRAETPKHQFRFPVSPFTTDGKLLPEVDPGPLAPAGTSDQKIQAYNFRVILTQNQNDMIPFPRPAHYDPQEFELLARYLEAFQQKYGRSPRLNEVSMPTAIPGNKADFNNNGPFSTDYIGKSWNYPNASYADRKKIWDEHLRYTQGFFYFLAHDSKVPSPLQHEMNSWGLPMDEFSDTGHWPFQLYIREGRRMLGEYVMRQADLQTDRTKADSIGMGSYNSDSHNVQRITTPDGRVENEGDVQVPVSPYQIPYRSILPKRTEVTNLLVPVCLSASHIAYSSLRMEPQYMILGEAAGLSASLAIEERKDVQDIDISRLQNSLLKDGAVLSLPSH
jgi:hypothetical protein